MSRTAPLPARHRLVAAMATVTLLGGLVSTQLATAAGQPLFAFNKTYDQYFSPDADGFEDTFTGGAEYTEPVTLTATVVRAGSTVRTLTGTGTEAADGHRYQVVWDGLDGAGGPAAAGEYVVTLDAVGQITGNTRSDTIDVGIDRTPRPTATIEGPAAGSVLVRGTDVDVRLSGPGCVPPPDSYLKCVVSDAVLRVVGTTTQVGRSFSPVYDEDLGEYDYLRGAVQAEPGNVPDGPVAIAVELSWTDPLFHQHTVSSAARTFTADSEPTLAVTSQAHYVFPHRTDGRSTSAYFSYDLGRSATVTVDVLNSADAVVATLGTEAEEAGSSYRYWYPGLFGDPVPAEGVYRFRAVADFGDGTPKTVTLPVGISHGDPTASITAPAAGGTLAGPVAVTVAVGAGLSVQYGSVSGLNGSTGSSSTYLGAFTYDEDGQGPTATATFDPAPLTDGPVRLRASVTAIDPLGGQQYLTTPEVAYTLEGRLEVTGPSTAVTFTVDGDPSRDSLSSIYRVNRTAAVTTEVRNSGGTVVRTLDTAVTRGPGTDHSATWDGKDAAGAYVPDGDYVLKVTASSSGRTAELTRPVAFRNTIAGTLALATPADRVSGSVEVVFTPKAGTAPTSVNVCDGRYTASTGFDGGYCSAVSSLTADETGGLWRGQVPTAQLGGNGSRSVHARAYSYDPVTFASSSGRTRPVALVVANPVVLTASASSQPLVVNDALRDRWVPTVTTSETAVITTVVTDSAGGTVRTLVGPSRSGYGHDVWWDGRDQGGALVPNGTYTATLTAVEDFVPSSDSETLTIVVQRADIGGLTAPVAGSVVADTVDLVYAPGPGIDVTSVSFLARRTPAGSYPDYDYLAGTTVEGTATQPVEGSDGRWTLTADTSLLDDGPYELFAQVGWLEPGSGYSYGGTPPVPVTVKQPGAIATVGAPRAFSPDADGYEDGLSLPYRTVKTATVGISVVRPDGSSTGVTAAPTTSGSTLAPGNHTFSWDGMIGTSPAAPGRYLVRWHAVDTAGAVDDEQVEVVVMGVPGALTGPDPAALSTGTVTFTWTPAAGATPTSVQVYAAGPSGGGAEAVIGDTGVAEASLDLLRRLVYPCGSCTPITVPWTNGAYNVTSYVTWKDELGYTHTPYDKAKRALRVVNPVAVVPSQTTLRGLVQVAEKGGPEVPFTGQVTFTQPTRLTGEVRSSGGAVVRTLAPVTDPTSQHAVSWDGKTADGTAVPDGAYSVVVTGTDPFAQLVSADHTFAVQVRRAAPARMTAPVSGDTVSGTPLFEAVAAPGVTLSRVQFIDTSGGLLAEGVEEQPGTWRAFADAQSRLADGPGTVGMLVTWRDASTPSGASPSYREYVDVVVNNTPTATDLPASRYFTPNGDGFEDIWSGKYASSSSGLVVTQWVETVVPEGTTPDRVRTLVNGTGRTQGLTGIGCERREERLEVNGEPTFTRIYNACESVAWDGRDSDGALVPDGVYRLVVRSSNSQGDGAQTSMLLGVEKRSPVTVAQDPSGPVGDTVGFTYTARPDFPAGSSEAVTQHGATGVRTNVQGLITQQTAAPQSDGTWTTRFDLPTSLPDTLAFSARASWLDQFGGTHTTVDTTTVTVDTTVLDLGFGATKVTGLDPLATGFRITPTSSGSGPLTYSIDPGDTPTGQEPVLLTGTLEAPYAEVLVPYTYTRPSATDYKATAVLTDAGGSRRFDTLLVAVSERPPGQPAVSLTVTPTSGIAPAVATATLSATSPDGGDLTYVVDWDEDGTPDATGPLTSPVTLTNAYEAPGLKVVQATVTSKRPGRTLTASGSAIARFSVGKDEPLAAVVRDGASAITTVDDSPVAFDGSGSTPVDAELSWEFGDGTGDEGAVVSHPYDAPGSYIAVLTTRLNRPGQPEQVQRSSQRVTVLDKTTASVSTVLVKELGGGALAGAQLVRTVGTEIQRATTGSDGRAVLFGLPQGVTTYDVYVPGYRPGVLSVTVEGNVGAGTAALVKGDPVDVSVTSARIAPDVAAAKYGFDPNAVSNQNFSELEVSLTYMTEAGEQPLTLRTATNDDGTVGEPQLIDPRTGKPQRYQCSRIVDGEEVPEVCSSGGRPQGATMSVQPLPEGKKAVVVVFSPKAGSLKELYEVSALVKVIGESGSSAALEDVSATLSYDHTGLALATLASDRPQQTDTQQLRNPDGSPARVAVSDTGGKSFSWLMRGEKAGDWDVDVTVDALLQPFGARVQAATKEPTTLKVFGTNAYKFVVQAPTSVTRGVPTRMRMGFENVTPAIGGTPLYGLSVELLKDNAKFQFAPGDSARYDFPDPLEPGKRVFRDYWVLPTFTGDLDLSASTIRRTKGAETTGAIPTDVIEAVEDDPEDKANPPTLTAEPDGTGAVRLNWSKLTGASEYRVFVQDDFGTTIAEPLATTSGLTATVVIPDSFEEPAVPTASRMASRMAAGSAVAPSASLTASGGTKVLLQAVVGGQKQLRHPLIDAFAACGGGKEGSFENWSMEGCLNQQADGWLAVVKAGELVKLNGFVIQPAGSTAMKLKMVTTAGAGALSANVAKVKVGFDAGELGIIPLYEGPLKWNLTSAEISFTVTEKTLAGIPISGAAKVKATAAGEVTVSLNGSAPAVLGGASGALVVKATKAAGLTLETLRIAIAKGNLAGVDYAGEVAYDAAKGGRSYKVTGTATLPKGETQSVTGSLVYDAAGKLTTGELKAAGLKLFGVAEVKDLALTTAGGATWHAALNASLSDGSSVKAALDYEVDQATNRVTKAVFSADKVVLKGLAEISGFAVTYAGDAAGQAGSSWTAKGTIKTTRPGAAVPAFSALFTTNGKDDPGKLGALKTGTLDVKDLPFAGLATVKSLHLDYVAAEQKYSGSVQISTPGKDVAGSGSFTVVDRVLQDVHLTLADARLGGILRISEGTFDYDRETATYKIASSKADVANLVGLTSFEASKVGPKWTLKGTGPDALGKTITLDSSITFTDGDISEGTIGLQGLSFAGLVPLDAVSLGYAPATGWSVAASGAEGAPELAFVVKDGAFTSASIKVPQAKLGGVADLSFHASYVAAGEVWSAGGEVSLPKGGKANDFALDMTYAKGVFTAGTIKGTLGLKGGLVVKIPGISYSDDGAKKVWDGKAGIVLPGPAGTAVDGSLRIVNGFFESGSIEGSNLNVPLGAGIFLQKAGLALALEPAVVLSGTLGLSAGPSPLKPVEVEATVSVTVEPDGTATYALDPATLSLVGTPLAEAGLTWHSEGEARFHGALGYGVAPIARLDAVVDASVNATGFQVVTTAQLQLLFQQLTGQVALDQDGGTACATVLLGAAPQQFPASIGFSWRWQQTPVPIEGSCSIGAFKPVGSAARTTAAGVASATSGSVTVPAGADLHALKVVGTTGAPQVRVTAPNGTAYTTPADPAADGVQPQGFMALRDTAAKATFVLLPRPQGGTWTVEVLDTDGNALGQLSSAPEVELPAVTGTLTGTGTSRTLAWTFPAATGRSVTFVETLASGQTRELVTTSDGTGSSAFTTVAGDGVRSVSAVVTQGTSMIGTVPVLSYQVSQTGSTPAPTPTPEPDDGGAGMYHALVPARVFDSREPGAGGKVVAGSDRVVGLLGKGGLPASGVSAVVVNTTVTGPTSTNDLQVYPTGRKPAIRTSNLNMRTGQTVADLVTVGLGDGGAVSLSGSKGATHVILDVVGWYGDGSESGGSGFHPLQPSRVLDTRSPAQPVGSGADRQVTVVGVGGVPASGVDAVVVNTTVVGSTRAADLQVYPAGAKPAVRTSNLNVPGGGAVANLVVVKVGDGGKVALSTSAGSTHVVLDVVGWYGSGAGAQRFHAVTPSRVLDTRTTAPAVVAGADRRLALHGAGGVPPTATAVVATVTLLSSLSNTDLQVYPFGSKPAVRTSNVNAPPRTAVPNLVMTGVGTGGGIVLSNSQGSAHAIVDVVGWFGP